MPTFVLLRDVSHVVVARAESSSEAASLGGKKALTPIIAGSVCGGVMLLAWIIGFGIYFRKRYNRKKRNRLIAEGKATPREKDLQILQEKVVIPPDPAVLLGQRKPGEMAFPEREHSKDERIPWSRHASHIKHKDSTPAPSKSQTSLMNAKPPTIADTNDNNSVTDEMTIPSHV